MACRVGMSTKPLDRIKYWKDQEGHTHSKILADKLTYDRAQAREEREATERGCRQSPGGKHVPGAVWSVYHVWGGR